MRRVYFGKGGGLFWQRAILDGSHWRSKRYIQKGHKKPMCHLRQIENKKMKIGLASYLEDPNLIHRLLFSWMEDCIIFFPNSIRTKSEKYGFNIICRYSKEMNFQPHPPNFGQWLIFYRPSMIFYSIFCVSNRKAEIWEKLLFLFLSSPQVV